ncbi:Myosin regulatory light polypeptide 9 [Lemmus lemmus]
MSSKRAKTKTTTKRPQHATSNVFAMFDQSQIQEIKESFNMIHQNRDGFIDKEDLHDMLASVDEEADELYREAPIDKKGDFNYIEFIRILKHGAKRQR